MRFHSSSKIFDTPEIRAGRHGRVETAVVPVRDGILRTEGEFVDSLNDVRELGARKSGDELLIAVPSIRNQRRFST